MDAAVAALLGAAIGAASGLGSAWLTTRMERSRHQQELVARAAIDEWRTHFSEPGLHMPLSDYVAFWLVYNRKVLELGKLEPEALKSALREAEDLWQVIEDLSRDREQRRAQGSSVGDGS